MTTLSQVGGHKDVQIGHKGWVFCPHCGNQEPSEDELKKKACSPRRKPGW